MSTERVLCVDDDAQVRMLIARVVIAAVEYHDGRAFDPEVVDAFGRSFGLVTA
jgi:hypothetical protein